MIKDLFFLYYLFAYSTGIIALFFSIFLYYNEKSILLKKYILFIISLLLVIAFGTISNSFPWDEEHVFIKDVFSFIMYLGPCLMVYILPNFINDLYPLLYKRIINSLFTFFSIFMLVILIISISLKKMPFAHYFIMIFLGMAIIYSIVRTFISFKKIKKHDLFYFIKQASVITLVLFPLLIIIDYNKIPIHQKAATRGPEIMPLIFIAYNILFVISAIRHIKNKKKAILEISSLFIDKYGISRREKEIIELLINGMSYKEIMAKLVISMPTVKTHISNIYNKTNTNSKMKLVHLLKQDSQ